ncbi:hypothetical protein MRX96_020025 [Rhipicephalus microplus]
MVIDVGTTSAPVTVTPTAEASKVMEDVTEENFQVCKLVWKHLAAPQVNDHGKTWETVAFQKALASKSHHLKHYHCDDWHCARGPILPDKRPVAAASLQHQGGVYGLRTRCAAYRLSCAEWPRGALCF